MPQVFAAVFYPSTLDDLVTISAVQRLSYMKVAIQQAHGQLSTYAATMKAVSPFFIFLAPEYYFVKSSVVTGVGRASRTTWTLYTEAEKKQIFDDLRALSGKYSRFLIAPGTLAWSKPAKAPQGNRTQDGWNTAPLFYEGKLKHEYDKIFDDGTFTSQTANVHFQKGVKSQLFTVASLKFGIEVCGDFDEGNLGKEAQAGSLDFELMLSATNPHGFDENSIANVPVRDGGYFLHADSDKPQQCGAWCMNRGSGSHGVVTPQALQGSTLFDPWTGKRVDKDGAGSFLAAGRLLALTSRGAHNSGNLPPQNRPVPQGNLRSSGSSWVKGAMPPRTNSLPQIIAPRSPASSNQPTAYALSMSTEPVQPYLSDVDGSFHVKATVTLTSGNTGLANKQVTFRAANGRTQDLVKVTNVQGVAEAIFTGKKAQPMRMSAEFNRTSVSYEAKIVEMGGGNVSKIARLQPETVLQMQSYFLPI